LVVEDDGQGLPAHPTSGMGMASMRARALRAGGTLTVTSSPGQGTSIHLVVPSARPSHPPAA
jgi:signal transduction histidine kinase